MQSFGGVGSFRLRTCLPASKESVVMITVVFFTIFFRGASLRVSSKVGKRLKLSSSSSAPGTIIWSKLHLIDQHEGILWLESPPPPISLAQKSEKTDPLSCKQSFSSLFLTSASQFITSKHNLSIIIIFIISINIIIITMMSR